MYSSNDNSGTSTVSRSQEQRYLWMPDHASKACTACGQSFTLFRRKHHCRLCGKIFCHSCSSQTLDGKPLGMDGQVRVCDDCNVIAGDIHNINKGYTTNPNYSMDSSSSSSNGTLNTNDNNNYNLSMEDEEDDSTENISVSNIHRRFDNNNNNNNGNTNPLNGTNNGRIGGLIVSSRTALQSNNGTMGYNASNNNENNTHSSNSSSVPVNPILSSNNHTNSTNIDEVRNNSMMNKSRKTHSDGGIGIFDDRNRLQAPKSLLFNVPANLQSIELLKNLAQSADQHLLMIIKRLIILYFPELSNNDNPSNATTTSFINIPKSPSSSSSSLPSVTIPSISPSQEEWATVLTRLTRRAIASIDPNIRAGDRADPRAYIKVKAIPMPLSNPSDNTSSPDRLIKDPTLSPNSLHHMMNETAPEESRVGPCEIIAGVVFRRNLPHKDMRTDINNPRIVLLDDTLQFEGSNAVMKLSHLGTLIEQERKYTELLVAKILTLRPDVFILSKSISRLALDMLRRGGVSVIANVKLALLQRISRCTGARILSSMNFIDKLPPDDIVGTGAGRFVLRNLPVPMALTSLIPSPSTPYTGNNGLVSPEPKLSFTNVIPNETYITPKIPRTQAIITPLPSSPSGNFLSPPFASPSFISPDVRLPPSHSTPFPVYPSSVMTPLSSSSSTLRSGRVTYIIIEGCPEHLGCTILLRGHPHDMKRTKAILHHALLIAWNLRLQTAFYFDTYMNIKPDASLLYTSNDKVSKLFALVAYLTPVQRLRLFRSLLLLPSSPHTDLSTLLSIFSSGSNNPSMHQLITKTYEYGPLPVFLNLPSSLNRIAALTGIDNTVLATFGFPTNLLNGTPNSTSPNGLPYPYFVSSSLTSTPFAIFDPLLQSANNESVLVTNCWLSEGNQCMKPRLRSIQFYDNSDKSIGWFLEERCFDERSICKACKKGPIAHTLSYVHGRGRVDITVHRLSHPIPLTHVIPSPLNSNSTSENAPGMGTGTGSSRPPLAPTGNGNRLPTNKISTTNSKSMPNPHTLPQSLPPLPGTDIITWSYCTLCRRHISPLTRLSRGAWSLSFGKFLELSFYHASTTVSGDTGCPHCPHTYHMRYFSRGRLATVFKFTPITPLDIIPRKALQVNKGWCKIQRDQEIDNLEKIITIVRNKMLNVTNEIYSTVKQAEMAVSLALDIANYLASVDTANSLLQSTGTTFATVNNRGIVLLNIIKNCAGTTQEITEYLTTLTEILRYNTRNNEKEDPFDVLYISSKRKECSSKILTADNKIIDTHTILFRHSQNIMDCLNTVRSAMDQYFEDTTITSLSIPLDNYASFVNDGTLNDGKLTMNIGALRNQFSERYENIRGPLNRLTSMNVSIINRAISNRLRNSTLIVNNIASSRSVASNSSTPSEDDEQVLRLFTGHLTLPAGLVNTVVPVDDEVTSSAIAYSLSAGLYWRKLQECVVAAYQRMNGENTIDGNASVNDISNVRPMNPLPESSSLSSGRSSNLLRRADSVSSKTTAEITPTSLDTDDAYDDALDDESLDDMSDMDEDEDDEFADELDMDDDEENESVGRTAPQNSTTKAANDHPSLLRSVSDGNIISNHAHLHQHNGVGFNRSNVGHMHTSTSGTSSSSVSASITVPQLRSNNTASTHPESLVPRSMTTGSIPSSGGSLSSSSISSFTNFFYRSKSEGPIAPSVTENIVPTETGITASAVATSVLSQSMGTDMNSPTVSTSTASVSSTIVPTHPTHDTLPLNNLSNHHNHHHHHHHRRRAESHTTGNLTKDTTVSSFSTVPKTNQSPVVIHSRRHSIGSPRDFFSIDEDNKNLLRNTMVRSNRISSNDELSTVKPNVNAPTDTVPSPGPENHSSSLLLHGKMRTLDGHSQRSLSQSEEDSTGSPTRKRVSSISGKSTTYGSPSTFGKTRVRSKLVPKGTLNNPDDESVSGSMVSNSTGTTTTNPKEIDPTISSSSTSIPTLPSTLYGNFGVQLPLTPAEMLRSDVKSDIVHSFVDRSESSPASFTVTSYWAMHFHALRALYLESQRSFVQSLAFSEMWNASGGKSGARFERSNDGRIVAKYLSKTEFDMFVNYIATEYFAHMAGTLVDNEPSLLVKILGIYKVQSSIGNGNNNKRSTHHVMIMEDLFYGFSVPEGMKFDLKGKVRSQKRQNNTNVPSVLPSPSATIPRVTPKAAPVGEIYNPFNNNENTDTSNGNGNSSTTTDESRNISSKATVTKSRTRSNSSSEGSSVSTQAATNLNGNNSRNNSFSEKGGNDEPTDSGDLSLLDSTTSVTNETGILPKPLAVQTQGSVSTVPNSLTSPALSENSGVSNTSIPSTYSNSSGLVLFDADLMAYTKGFPVPLTPSSKIFLDSALRRDTGFLCNVAVVDYSILLGIDSYTGRAAVGGIDYLRRFDIVKRLENRMKSVTQLATNIEPTVVQPERYMERLLKASDRYFMLVPDKWTTANGGMNLHHHLVTNNQDLPNDK